MLELARFLQDSITNDMNCSYEALERSIDHILRQSICIIFISCLQSQKDSFIIPTMVCTNTRRCLTGELFQDRAKLLSEETIIVLWSNTTVSFVLKINHFVSVINRKGIRMKKEKIGLANLKPPASIEGAEIIEWISIF